jgi:uncharacterized membrane protein YhaH (DUF805 family)
MFKNPFSFEGRIRRTEFGLSFIIYIVAYAIVAGIGAAAGRDGAGAVILLGMIPLVWFLWAQGAKRCHDVGNSGWWQLIPFYGLWLIFQDGQPGANQYGENPKGIQVIGGQTFQGVQNTSTSGGYQGGYSGGHNSPNTNYSSTENPTKTEGYKDGDLYK